MKRALALASASICLASASSAHADYEAWFWIENRTPIVRAEGTKFPRIDLRTFVDVRTDMRSHGLHQSFLRVGPLFYLTDFLFVGIHGTIYADRLASGTFAQEGRFEVEPNFFGRIGHFTWNDRNRFEVRVRDTGTRYRYRNQLRANYAPKGAKWIPYAWEEVLVDLSGLGLNQNRASIGLGRMLTPNIRVDAGFMLRSREEPTGWVHDRALTFYLFVDVPPAVIKK